MIRLTSAIRGSPASTITQAVTRATTSIDDIGHLNGSTNRAIDTEALAG